MATIAPPYPYMGGKRKIAPLVWSYLGDPKLYVEPFFGGGGVFLARPSWHKHRRAVINDANCFITNFWRAVKYAPEEVARHADFPPHEAELHARHLWLMEQANRIREGVLNDPEFYDSQAAAYWAWGLCLWIGDDWCARENPKRQIAAIPRGMARFSGDELKEYLQALSQRLKDAIVLCGDWKRCLTPGMLRDHSTVGVFLDPPYPGYEEYYAPLTVSPAVWDDVVTWCLENGDKYRVVLCGQGDDGRLLLDAGWREIAWVANRPFPRRDKEDTGRRFRERVWISPRCGGQQRLF